MESQATLVILVLTACLFNFGGAQITGWTKPSDVTSPNGKSTEEFKVNENAATNDVVDTFAATPTGQDTIAKYEVLTSDTPFAIDNTGKLTVSGSLDYETKKNYEIQIKATDSKDNTGTATVTIKVTDINEGEPKFGQTSYSVCVVDKAAAATSVTTFSATDTDTDNTITYSIHSGDSSNDFKISTTKLEVNTGKTLDMKTTEKYTLVIYAKDDGSDVMKTGSATYTINVETSCNNGAALTVTFFTIFLALIMSLSW